MIQWFEKHNKTCWLITIFGAVAIFIISGINFSQSETISKAPNIISVIYHLCAFFLFAFFLNMSLIKGKQKPLIFFLAILLAFGYAISDEFHQFFVPGRFCSYSDIFIDGVGIIFALMSYTIILKLRK